MITRSHSRILKNPAGDIEVTAEAQVKWSDRPHSAICLGLRPFSLICNPHSDARMISPVHELHQM